MLFELERFEKMGIKGSKEVGRVDSCLSFTLSSEAFTL